MSIPLHIILTNPTKNKYESLYLACNDQDECYNKIIVTVKNALLLSVNYPGDYEEFKNLIWYNGVSFDNEVFDYSIFIEGKWIKPWSQQEIYDAICDIIHNLDLQNSIYNKRNTYDYVSDSDESEDGK
jgi:hypothetical protein